MYAVGYMHFARQSFDFSGDNGRLEVVKELIKNKANVNAIGRVSYYINSYYYYIN